MTLTIKRPVGLISAVPEEGQFFLKKLARLKKSILDRTTCYEGRLHDLDIVCDISGIGKTNAVHALTCLIQSYSPAFVINFGIGGAYPSSGLKIGDLAIATNEVYADEGVLVDDGFRTLETIGIPLLKAGRKRYFNEFPLDLKLCRTAMQAGKRTGANTKSGIFTTVSLCTGSAKRAREISSRFGAICENMEGAAIAHICCLYRIPCLEIRGISNMVEERDISKWDISLAAENCQKALIELFHMRETGRAREFVAERKKRK